MAQIHLLHHCLSCWCHWRTPLFLFRHDLQWREGPSLYSSSKCTQCHLLLSAGHPRHHAPLHPPLPSHVFFFFFFFFFFLIFSFFISCTFDKSHRRTTETQI